MRAKSEPNDQWGPKTTDPPGKQVPQGHGAARPGPAGASVSPLPPRRSSSSAPGRAALTRCQKPTPAVTCHRYPGDRRDRPLHPGCSRPEERDPHRKSKMVPRSTAGARKPRPRPSDTGRSRRGNCRERLSGPHRFPASAGDYAFRRAGRGGRLVWEAGSCLRFPRGCVWYGGASVATRPARLSMPGVKLTTQAYCKMVLHGAKYPHCAVNGLLVAERQRPRKEHPQGAGSHTLFVDCIPLFHGTLALAPMLEVALTLVSLGPQGDSGLGEVRCPSPGEACSPGWAA